MTSGYWAWVAILMDFGLFVGPLPMAHSIGAFFAVWSVHATSCAILATVTYALLPACYRKPHLLIWLLMFGFAFIVPVIGAIGVLLVARTTLQQHAADVERAVPHSVVLPEFELHGKASRRAGQGAIRMRLASNVPNDIRMQSLLTLQVVPNRVANPILEGLLGDETDDVRLVAFGMLDAEEKKITSHIRQKQSALEAPMTDEQRHDCLQHLAELHWELIYSSLVQGELRRHMLAEALRYADEAVTCGSKPNAGLHFLRGRILMAQSEFGKAEASMRQAVMDGLAAATALPYLAEIAFRNGHYDVVHAILLQLVGVKTTGRIQAVVQLWSGQVDTHTYDHLAPATQAVVDLWTGRDSVLNFRDRRILNHI